MSFSDIPDDILFYHLLPFLEHKDIFLSFFHLNKQCKHLSEHPQFWKTMCFRDMHQQYQIDDVTHQISKFCNNFSIQKTPITYQLIFIYKVRLLRKDSMSSTDRAYRLPLMKTVNLLCDMDIIDTSSDVMEKQINNIWEMGYLNLESLCPSYYEKEYDIACEEIQRLEMIRDDEAQYIIHFIGFDTTDI